MTAFHVSSLAGLSGSNAREPWTLSVFGRKKDFLGEGIAL